MHFVACSSDHSLGVVGKRVDLDCWDASNLLVCVAEGDCRIKFMQRVSMNHNLTRAPLYHLPKDDIRTNVPKTTRAYIIPISLLC